MPKRHADVNRRTILKGAGAAAGFAGLSAITGFPNIARAESNTIRIGMPTILSGRVAILGTSTRAAAKLAVQRFNDAGGVNGRKVELVARDSKGAPDLAAKVTRDLINSDGCEIILDGEASSGAFAVQEVIRELPVLCIHTNSETSKLTADPKIRSKTAFRCARQGIHDAVAGGLYASRIAKSKNQKRLMSCSPDYAYGRDNTAQFIEYLKKYDPDVEVIDQAWPKLFEPDYTAFATRILQQKPDALYSALWGGDLVSFIKQANLYGLFSGDMSFFSGALADPPVLSAIQQLPAGLHSVYRYDPDYPDSEANAAFAADYKKLEGELPTNWSWQTYTGYQFIFEALKRTNGKTDGSALADEVAGMEIDSPFVKDGKMKMREDDHTIINYPVAWGTTTDKKSMTDWVAGDWDEILDQEKQWKQREGYL